MARRFKSHGMNGAGQPWLVADAGLCLALLFLGCSSGANSSGAGDPKTGPTHARPAEPGESAEIEAPDRTQAPVILPTAPRDARPEQIEREAIELAKRLRRNYSRSPEALHVAAMFYADLHRSAEAEEAWKDCLELDSDHGGSYVGLATIASGRGEDETAIAMLREARSKGIDSPEVFYHLANSLTKVGQIEDAVAVAEEGLTRHPQAADVWQLLGENQLRLGQFAEAEARLRKAVALGARTESVYYSLANACARQGKTEEAETFRKQFSELKDRSASPDGQWFEVTYPKLVRRLATALRVNAAEFFLRSDAHAQAEVALLEAVAIDPANARALTALATLYYGQKRLQDAQTVLRRLAEIEPNNPFHQLNLANLAMESDDPAAAEESFGRLVELAPQAAVGYAGLAELYWRTGQLDKAQSQMRKALEREPTAEGFLQLAEICRALDDPSGAEEALAQAGRLANVPAPRQLPTQGSDDSQ